MENLQERGFGGDFRSFFPTCQVRVSRFYQSCFLLLLLPLLLQQPRISTASSGSQWALPGLNRQISVGTAGPHQRAPDVTHTECQNRCQKKCWNECLKRCQIMLDNARQIVRIDARQNTRNYMKLCQNRCQLECQIECQNICRKYCRIECQNKYAMFISKWYARNYVRTVFQGGEQSKKVIARGNSSN